MPRAQLMGSDRLRSRGCDEGARRTRVPEGDDPHLRRPRRLGLQSGPTLMRRFLMAALPTTVPLAAITVVLATQPGGQDAMNAVRDLGQAVLAFAAMVSC